MFAGIAVVLFIIIRNSNGCASVPDGCPRDKISFYLYTEQTQNDSPHELQLENTETIQNAPFVADANFKFIIHGYENSKDTPLMVKLRDEYFKQGKWNLIYVDYAPLAETGCYIQTTFPSVPVVGKCGSELINSILKNREEIKIDRFHVIGFSMGAQIAAEVSVNLHPEVLPRITGLDPAWPLFYPLLTTKCERLNRSHAKFVDILHTNAGWCGVLYSLGTYDIYANNGSLQPGCGIPDISTIWCSHSRAMEYYIESINSKKPFIAHKCSIWEWMTLRSCDADKGRSMVIGEHIKPPENSDDEGIYVFHTADKAPFALGQTETDG